jgi:hypothetical protein
MPCHHRLLQRRIISQFAGTVIQRRGLCGIDIDFGVVVGQSLSPLFLSRQLQPLAYCQTHRGGSGEGGYRADPVIDVDFDLRRMDASPNKVIDLSRACRDRSHRPLHSRRMAVPAGLGMLTGKGPILRGRGYFILRSCKATSQPRTHVACEP